MAPTRQHAPVLGQLARVICVLEYAVGSSMVTKALDITIPALSELLADAERRLRSVCCCAVLCFAAAAASCVQHPEVKGTFNIVIQKEKQTQPKKK